jgi:hypothetical protein
MVVVAIAGVVLGGVRLRRRQTEYRLQAAAHGAAEVALRNRAEWAGRMATKGYVSRREEEGSRARADQHRRLKALYEQAASRPWLSVTPDATGPE